MANNTKQNLTYKKILIFWLPLAGTWLMMSIEGPFLSAIIARLAEPKFNLAAYGVAYSFALIIEAPVIMMMTASTALVKNFQSFKVLRNFNVALITLITLVMLILIIPFIFFFITEELIKLPHHVSVLTHYATIILLPWPAAIGYRRFYQGILIKSNLTKRVAYGTILRLITMIVTAFIMFTYTETEGVVVGATSLSLAVVIEAAASRIMAAGTIKKIATMPADLHESLTYKKIIKFYYPLALTSLIGLGVQPLVTFFIVQSRMAIESLAVLPVITSFVFIFRAFGLSYQEVVITFIDNKNNSYKILKNFAVILSIVLTISLSLIAFSPLSDVWFITVAGLSKFLSDFSSLPLMIMTILPMLTVLISFQRAVLVTSKKTSHITAGTAVEFISILFSLYILINYFSPVGAVAATSSFVIGRLFANLYLSFPVKESVNNFKQI